MKAFIVLAALVACGQAGLVGHHVGSSVSSRAEDGLGNYKFSYKEGHATGGTFRSEAGNPWGVVGSYGLHDVDGRQRVVNYVADGHGFRASVKTNEPGTAPQAAAATSIATPGKALVAHASYAAPVAVAAHGYSHGYGFGHGYGHGYAHAAAPAGHSYGYGVAHAHGYGHY